MPEYSVPTPNALVPAALAYLKAHPGKPNPHVWRVLAEAAQTGLLRTLRSLDSVDQTQPYKRDRGERARLLPRTRGHPRSPILGQPRGSYFHCTDPEPGFWRKTGRLLRVLF